MSRQNQTEVRNRRGGIRQTGRNLSGSSLISPLVQQGQNVLDNLDTEVTGIQKPTAENTRTNKRGGIITGQSGDATEGSSPEPDNADQIRIVGRPAMGARQREVRGRQFPRGDFGGDYPDDATLTSPISSLRNKERAEILDAESLTPMKLRAIKEKYKKIASDKAKAEASNDSPSEDSQVMGMPKDQADAVESGGSVETVIDGDNETSTITRPEDTTPPASRRQQPDFDGEAPGDSASPEDSAENAGRAYTMPNEVTPKKSFTVSLDLIPGPDATPAEWQEYFRKLDAGELTR